MRGTVRMVGARISASILAMVLFVGFAFGALPVLAASADDFEYEDRDTYIRITGYNGTDKDVVVPDAIDGKPVKQIYAISGKGVFEDKDITSVIIPATITFYGSSTFYGNPNLNKFYFKGAAPGSAEMGSSVFSSVADEGTKTSAPPVLNTPESFAVCASSANSIALGWKKVPGADRYELLRTDVSDGSLQAKEVAGNATSYTDTTVEPGKVYTYTLYALSTFYGVERSSPQAKTHAVAADTGVKSLRVTAKDHDSISLQWASKGDFKGGYQLYRATSAAGKYTLIATRNSATTQYKDTALTAGATYYYKVRASYMREDIAVNGIFSAVVPGKTVLGTPTSLKAASVGPASARLTWKKTPGAGGYILYRSTTGKVGSFKTVKTIASGTTLTYTDKMLDCGKTYYYRIAAYSSLGGVKFTGAAGNSLKVKPELKKPTGLSAKASGRKVKLTWKKPEGASGYTIYRSTTGKAGSYKKIKTIKSGSKQTYTDKKLKAKTKYYYKIVPYTQVNDKIVSGKSAVFSGVKTGKK